LNADSPFREIRAERDFKVNQGLEAQEWLFEEVDVEYWDPFRSSVVCVEPTTR